MQLRERMAKRAFASGPRLSSGPLTLKLGGPLLSRAAAHEAKSLMGLPTRGMLAT